MNSDTKTATSTVHPAMRECAADPVPVPGTAGTFDRALAASGRDALWAA
ncbi:hypothetical protein ACIBBB_00905 [Streptomyces sp. NPDC051217]